MFGLSFTEEVRPRDGQGKYLKGPYKSLGHGAASIRKTAIESIRQDPLGEPSDPGQPIHTRRGFARRAILFAVDRMHDEAVIGFADSKIGDAMSGHELGERYKGADFPERPTMAPAMRESAFRFAQAFEGSLGEL